MSVKKWFVFIASFLTMAVVFAVMNIPIAGGLSIVVWLFDGVSSAIIVLKCVFCVLLVVELIPTFVHIYRTVKKDERI